MVRSGNIQLTNYWVSAYPSHLGPDLCTIRYSSSVDEDGNDDDTRVIVCPDISFLVMQNIEFHVCNRSPDDLEKNKQWYLSQGIDEPYAFSWIEGSIKEVVFHPVHPKKSLTQHLKKTKALKEIIFPERDRFGNNPPYVVGSRADPNATTPVRLTALEVYFMEGKFYARTSGNANDAW